MARKRKRDFVPTLKKTSVVKCALKKRCKNQNVYDEIQRDVTDMSAVAVEASRYMHFCLMRDFSERRFPREPIPFKKFFNDLCGSSRNGYKANVDHDYYLIRPNSLPLYAIYAQRSNIIVYLANQLGTSFKNNLKTHAWPRLRRFFKSLFHPDDNMPFTNTQINNTLSYLLNTPSEGHPEAVPDEILLNGLEHFLGWERDHLLRDFDGKYYEHVKLFYDLQRYNENRNLKNFKLIPQNHFGAVHIQYDQQGMFQMLTRLNEFKPGEDEQFYVGNQFRDVVSKDENYRKKMWRTFFKLPETDNKKFDYMMSTDGVTASFVMRSAKPAELLKDEQRELDLHRIQQKVANREYDAMIGLDPGAKLMVGGIIHDKVNDNLTEIKPIKISSKHYHNRSGFTTRYALLHKWTTPEVTQHSSMSRNYIAYAQYQLSIFAAKQREFSQRKVVRLKLKKYICTTKICVQLAEEIIGDHQNVFIAIGSSEIAANSPIKGYRRVPHRKLVKELRHRADVLLVDEFRTTKLCTRYRQVNIISQSPHRYLFCPNCHTHWHRDVSAGVNILYKAECEITGVAVHPNFNRNTQLI